MDITMDYDSWIAFRFTYIMMAAMTDRMMDQMMACVIIFHHHAHLIIYFTISLLFTSLGQ